MPSQLRDQAAVAAGKSTDVAKPSPKAELIAKVSAMKNEFQTAMPKTGSIEAAQLIRDAMTVVSNNPKLEECDAVSFIGALMSCAQLGLRPGVLGQAYILPFFDRRSGKTKAQLIVGYQGGIILCHRSGDIASVEARIVYEHDKWDYWFGLDSNLVHRPAAGDRGKAIAYYAVIKTKSGGVMWDVMTRADAERHRDLFATAKKRDGSIFGPWVDHFDAMALKTVLIKVLKYAPRSTELQNAIAADQSVRVDASPTADIASVSMPTGPTEDDGIPDAEIIDSPADPPADPNASQGWGPEPGSES
jgi:recombination protein RecT